MPNVLAHIGAQTIASRAVSGRADVRWIFIGCLLPDIPWIFHRIIVSLAPGSDVYDLRLYAVIQSSLFLSLILAGALSALARSPFLVMGILGTNCLLHLLLDGLQTKWGNGVQLFAPLSWKLWNAGLFWPEDGMSYVLTATGLGVMVWCLLRGVSGEAMLVPPSWRRYGMAIMGFGLYVALPPVFFGVAEAADVHSVNTLRQIEQRPGSVFKSDRWAYKYRSGQATLRTFTGEHLRVLNPMLERDAILSVQGVFVGNKSVELQQIHEHLRGVRDLASVTGLLLVAVVVARPLFGWKRRRPRQVVSIM